MYCRVPLFTVLAGAGLLTTAASYAAPISGPIVFGGPGAADNSWPASPGTSFTLTNDLGGPEELSATFTSQSYTFDSNGDIDAISPAGAFSFNSDRIGFSSTRFNNGDGFSIIFDKDVELLLFDQRIGGGRNPDWKIQVGFTDIGWDNTGSLITVGSGGFTDPGIISAGTPIYFAVNSNDNDRSDGLEDITVQIIPEPASLTLMGLGGLCLLSRRRKA